MLAVVGLERPTAQDTERMIDSLAAGRQNNLHLLGLVSGSGIDKL